MKYLVMECHPAYAIVLDENGRFLRVANLGYAVGDRISDVFGPAESPAQPSKVISIRRWAAPLASMAACLCVMFTAWQFALMPYGTVRMEINPDVKLTVSRIRRVTGLEALNEDGESLVENYFFWGKTLSGATGELADMAKEQGFLDSDGIIRLTVDSEHEKWKQDAEERLLKELKEHVGEQVSVTLSDMEEESTAKEAALTVEEEISIVVPVTPVEETIETTAKKMPETTVEKMPETTAEKMPGMTAEKTTEETTEKMAEKMPETTAEDRSPETEASSVAESRAADGEDRDDRDDDRDDSVNEQNGDDDEDDDENDQDDDDDGRDDAVNGQDDDDDVQDDAENDQDNDGDVLDDDENDRDDDDDEQDDDRDDDEDDRNEDDDSREEDDD